LNSFASTVFIIRLLVVKSCQRSYDAIFKSRMLSRRIWEDNIKKKNKFKSRFSGL